MHTRKEYTMQKLHANEIKHVYGLIDAFIDPSNNLLKSSTDRFFLILLRFL